MKPRDLLSLGIRITGFYWLAASAAFFIALIPYLGWFSDDSYPWSNAIYNAAMVMISVCALRYASSIATIVWPNPPNEPLLLGVPSPGWYAFAFGTFGALFTISEISRFGRQLVSGLSMEPRFEVLPFTPMYFVWNSGVSAILIALGVTILFRAPSLGRWLYSKHQTNEKKVSEMAPS